MRDINLSSFNVQPQTRTGQIFGSFNVIFEKVNLLGNQTSNDVFPSNNNSNLRIGFCSDVIVRDCNLGGLQTVPGVGPIPKGLGADYALIIFSSKNVLVENNNISNGRLANVLITSFPIGWNPGVPILLTTAVTLRGNNIDNSTGDGISIQGYDIPEVPGSTFYTTCNTIEKNNIRQNSGNGIYLDIYTKNNLLIENRIFCNDNEAILDESTENQDIDNVKFSNGAMPPLERRKSEKVVTYTKKDDGYICNFVEDCLNL
jgi:hypothetical protein